VEALVERVLADGTALAHVRSSKTPKPGRRLVFEPGIEAEVTGRRDDLFVLRFDAGGLSVFEVLEGEGERADFVAAYGKALLRAYPPQAFGTVFALRRIFAVAHKRK